MKNPFPAYKCLEFNLRIENKTNMLLLFNQCQMCEWVNICIFCGNGSNQCWIVIINVYKFESPTNK